MNYYLLKTFIESLVYYIINAFQNYNRKKEIEPIRNKIKDFLKKN